MLGFKDISFYHLKWNRWPCSLVFPPKGTFSLIIEAWNAESPTEYTGKFLSCPSSLIHHIRLTHGYFLQQSLFPLQTTKTTWWVAWPPGGDWPSVRTGLRTCTSASRASCATPTTSSATSTTSETPALITVGRETTRWDTTPATRRATASVWRAGKETTALNVRVEFTYYPRALDQDSQIDGGFFCYKYSVYYQKHNNPINYPKRHENICAKIRLNLTKPRKETTPQQLNKQTCIWEGIDTEIFARWLQLITSKITVW